MNEERVLSARAELKERLETSDPELAKAFDEMSPEQKAAGRFVGMVATKGQSAESIEDAMTWYEKQCGIVLSPMQKMLLLYVALQNIVDLSDSGYRACRKFFLSAVNQ